jgi:uncharacterized protein (TIGR02001 family)
MVTQLVPIMVLLFLIPLRSFAAENKAKSTPPPVPTVSGAEGDEDEDDDGDDDSDTDTEDEGKNNDDDAQAGQALSGNVTLASDYILRGLSQTDHNPVVQGGFDWEHPTGFYLGAWGSNVHFQDLPSSLELDGYGGYTYHFKSDLSVSLGALYYSYWADGDRNSWEIPLKSAWKTFSFEVDYSPRWQGQDAQSWYLLGGWQDKFFWDVKFGLSAGYAFFAGTNSPPSYADFLVSASREFLDVEWTVSGIFVNKQFVNDSQGGSRAIFSVTKAF